MKFKDNLSDLRKNKNLNQQQIADELGITNTTISRYESGEREPDLDTLLKIAEYFNVSVDYLLGRIDYNNVIEINLNQTKPRKSLNDRLDIIIDKLENVKVIDEWQPIVDYCKIEKLNPDVVLKLLKLSVGIANKCQTRQ